MSAQPDSMLLQWHITERCNWRCKHCYQESYTTPEFKLPELLSVRDKFLSFLDSFEAPIKKAKINITGGEPFARTDILEFLSEIAKDNSRWQWGMLSNGSFLNKENVKYLKFLGINSFQVSMEGMKETNDSIRGAGAFNKTLGAITLLREAGIKTRVSMTLSGKNKKDIFGLAKILAPMGVRTLGVRRIVPWGSAKSMMEFMLSPRELSETYREIEEMNIWLIKKNFPLRVTGGCETGIYYDKVRYDKKTGEQLMSKNNCGVRDGQIITLLPDGTVFACRRLPIPAGNIKEKSFREIYDSEKMAAFRNIAPIKDFEACGKCPNFENCFGGALCVNYGFTGKWNMPDAQCDRAFGSLEEAVHFAKKT